MNNIQVGKELSLGEYKLNPLSEARGEGGGGGDVMSVPE